MDRRVALCGDSHLAVASSRGVKKLGPRLVDAGFEVDHHARGGWDTRAALASVERIDAPFAVLCFGSNDCAPWKEVPLVEFEQNLRTLLGRARRASVLVLGPPPVDETGRGVLDRSNALVRAYSTAAERAAGDAGASFLALLNVLRDDGSHHVEDGLHLNDAAYELVSDRVLVWLRRTQQPA